MAFEGLVCAPSSFNPAVAEAYRLGEPRDLQAPLLSLFDDLLDARRVFRRAGFPHLIERVDSLLERRAPRVVFTLEGPRGGFSVFTSFNEFSAIPSEPLCELIELLPALRRTDGCVLLLALRADRVALLDELVARESVAAAPTA